MKTRPKMRRGAPAYRRNPPRMVVSPLSQPKETAKMLKNWSARNEANQVAFHAWQLSKHLCLLSYHALCAFCKLTFGLLVAHHERIIEFILLSINMDMEYRVHTFRLPHK
jgi:hypothetical protein